MLGITHVITLTNLFQEFKLSRQMIGRFAIQVGIINWHDEFDELWSLENGFVDQAFQEWNHGIVPEIIQAIDEAYCALVGLIGILLYYQRHVRSQLTIIFLILWRLSLINQRLQQFLIGFTFETGHNHHWGIIYVI